MLVKVGRCASVAGGAGRHSAPQPRGECRHEHLCGGVFRLRRGPDRVVVASSAFDDDLGFAQSVELLIAEGAALKLYVNGRLFSSSRSFSALDPAPPASLPPI